MSVDPNEGDDEAWKYPSDVEPDDESLSLSDVSGFAWTGVAVLAVIVGGLVVVGLIFSPVVLTVWYDKPFVGVSVGLSLLIVLKVVMG